MSQSFNILNTLKKLLFLTPADKEFVKFCRKKWSEPEAKKIEGELLIDQMFMDGYIFSRAYISNYFFEQYHLQCKHFHFIARERKLLRLFFTFFRKFSRINKLYQSFNSKYGFGQSYFNESQQALNTLNFTTKRELLNFKFKGILIGDLIYDTYLREYALPTVDLKDKRLDGIIINALDIFLSIQRYLDSNNVQKVVLSHAVYIQYGILARIAISRDIDVYNFPWENVVHKLTHSNYKPHINHLQHKELFKIKDNKENCREEARLTLEKRFNGEIDVGIIYMSTSPYKTPKHNKKAFLHNGKPKVALFLHCFYDAPHIYKDMIFEDFYEWVDFVFSRVKDMNVDFVVKPHPNAKPFNVDIIEDLKDKYPHIRVLDKDISHTNLIEEGINLLLTVYGTASYEFAYHGIKVMTAGDNPTAAYKFCKHAKTKEEFEYYLMNIDKIDPIISKEEIQEFFYMHYLNSGRGKISGNNDLFLMRTRDYGPSNLNIFSEMINDASLGKFDNVYNLFTEALRQVDEARL